MESAHGTIGHNPIRVINASSMFRREISKNEKPYLATALKFNNKLVDEWEKEILKKICNKEGMIRDGQILSEWQSFYTGKIIYGFMENLEKGYIMRPSKECVEYWKKIFTSCSVDEMLAIGAVNISYGWKLMTDENFILGMLEKWEVVYSKTKEPMMWRELNGENPKLWAKEHDNKFWDENELKDVYERVMTVTKTIISPQ